MISSLYRSASFFLFVWFLLDEHRYRSRENEKEEKEMPIIAVLLPAEGVKSYIRFPLLRSLCLSSTPDGDW